jgi:hypothetical protein
MVYKAMDNYEDYYDFYCSYPDRELQKREIYAVVYMLLKIILSEYNSLRTQKL